MNPLPARFSPRSKFVRCAAAATAALAAVAVVPALQQDVSAQTPALYDCRINGGPASVMTLTGSATASPSPATVGQAIALTDVNISLDLHPSSAAPSLPTPGVTGQATLGPAGWAHFTTGTMIDTPFAIHYTGGTGATTAEGTSGGTMNITVPELTVHVPGVTFTCLPQGAAAVIHVLQLTGNPPVPPEPIPPRPAPPVPGRPNHAG